MSKFKVGDKVRILDGTKQDGWRMNGSMKKTIGMAGKIIDIDDCDPKYRVMFEDDWWDYNEEDLEKENSMNLELNNLTDEQKKQIIELAKKFEQENEVDKFDRVNDFEVASQSREVDVTRRYSKEFMNDFFDLGLTAHTKEEAEKIRRRLLVEKELRDWAKKCKGKVDWEGNQRKYYVQYEVNTNVVAIDDFINYVTANVYFTEREVAKQAIKSIGQERLIRDYFGIERGEK